MFLEKLAAKISSIRQATSSASPPDCPPTNCRFSNPLEVTSAELQVLNLTYVPKTCELDPEPMFLVRSSSTSHFILHHAVQPVDPKGASVGFTDTIYPTSSLVCAVAAVQQMCQIM